VSMKVWTTSCRIPVERGAQGFKTAEKRRANIRFAAYFRAQQFVEFLNRKGISLSLTRTLSAWTGCRKFSLPGATEE
jgi:hypothetical protein